VNASGSTGLGIWYRNTQYISLAALHPRQLEFVYWLSLTIHRGATKRRHKIQVCFRFNNRGRALKWDNTVCFSPWPTATELFATASEWPRGPRIVRLRTGVTTAIGFFRLSHNHTTFPASNYLSSSTPLRLQYDRPQETQRSHVFVPSSTGPFHQSNVSHPLGGTVCRHPMATMDVLDPR
jgi:hypothetical protein